MAPGTVKEASSTVVSQSPAPRGPGCPARNDGPLQMALRAQTAPFSLGRRRVHNAATAAPIGGYALGVLALPGSVGLTGTWSGAVESAALGLRQGSGWRSA